MVSAPGFFTAFRRTIFFIDGFNLYYSLNENKAFHKYKWLDFSELCTKFLRPGQKLEKVLYFTSLTVREPEKKKRHKILIRALRTKNIEIVYGKFGKDVAVCPNCVTRFEKPKEKQTDVNLAVHLLEYARKNKYDDAILVTGDTDLIPVIRAVRTGYPDKRLGLLFPVHRNSDCLKEYFHFHYKIEEKHLVGSLLPLSIDLPNGKRIICPQEWKQI